MASGVAPGGITKWTPPFGCSRENSIVTFSGLPSRRSAGEGRERIREERSRKMEKHKKMREEERHYTGEKKRERVSTHLSDCGVS